jgi:hypothetical protein
MHAICTTCGTQFAASEGPPARCPICEDERQYVGWGGQGWTTLEELRGAHRLAVRDQGDGLLGLGIEPKFAIGQRAPAGVGSHFATRPATVAARTGHAAPGLDRPPPLPARTIRPPVVPTGRPRAAAPPAPARHPDAVA